MKNQPAVRSLRFRIGLFVLAWVLVFVGFVSYRYSQALSSWDDGNQAAAKAQISGLKAFVEEYEDKCGTFPTTEQGLDALVRKPSAGPDCKAYPSGGILKDGKIPKDPWGNPFVYTGTDNTYVITSLGKDGREGGEGYDEDIRSY